MNANLSKPEGPEWWRELPFPYSAFQISEGSRPEGFRFHSHIVNIEAELWGREIGACGEADSRELAMTKAIAELLERSALAKWKRHNPNKLSSSNGWAAHTDFDAAKSAAILELIERDAVLAQWYTATPFQEIPTDELPTRIQKWQKDELVKSEFPILKVLLSTRGLGPSVTCVFMNEKGYGVSSHATRMTLAESIESAIAEACRAAHLSLRKAFWQDTLKLKAGNDATVKNGAHAVYYAYEETLPTWMFGSRVYWETASVEWKSRIETALKEQFHFEVALESPLIVGRASHESALPLVWGPTDIEQVLKTAAGKKLVTQSTEWNLKPHIIS